MVLPLGAARASAQAPPIAPPPAGGGVVADSPRRQLSLNAGWRYHSDGVNLAEKPAFPDERWERVTVPHTWNARDPFDDEPGYRRGIGWYRRTLDVDPSWRGKRLFLHFEGVNQKADVYVNGAFAGEHRGGYTAFTLDVTRWLRVGDTGNVVAVQVDNSHDPFVPPLSVGFALYGGIYRDVWLIATDPVHVEMLDHGSSGVSVRTPVVSRDSALVVVRGAVRNEGDLPAAVRVVSTVRDAGDRVVAEAATRITVPPEGATAWTAALPAVRAPRLWSPAAPSLYSVRTDVHVGDALRDRVTVPLGFRWFSFDGRTGFSLNGERVALHGTNRHQDHAGIGSALSDAQHERDLAIIKEMGANFVRLAHYPQDPAVLDAADRLGLLVWEEIPVVNYITDAPEFTRTTEQMLREMIRQHGNHPSVILWGTMNEVLLWGPSGARVRAQTDTPYMRRVRSLAARLDSLARAEDPARATAMAIHMSRDYDATGISRVPQVLGLNVYDGWYSGTFDGLGTNLDRRHSAEPGRPLFVSEYGAEDDHRVNSLAPERFDFSGTWMRRFHEAYLAQIAARPWLAGAAVWNQFDFSQPETGGSIPYMNQKGLLTWDRRPKDVYYLYKANWNPEPMVYIASRGWMRRQGPSGKGDPPGTATQPVDVYSNLAAVELLVNGRSLGTRTPDAVRRITWDVPFVDGANVLVARGERAKVRYSDELPISFTYRPARLADPHAPVRELAVNVGARAQVVDDAAVVWEGDQPYREGEFGAVGGTAAIFDKDLAITGTALAPLYFSYRAGLTEYRLDVADGDYELELLFAEPQARPGTRVFDVSANGVPIVRALDLAARHGIGRAASYAARVSAVGGSGIVVQFTALTGQPLLNALHVRRR